MGDTPTTGPTLDREGMISEIIDFFSEVIHIDKTGELEEKLSRFGTPLIEDIYSTIAGNTQKDLPGLFDDSILTLGDFLRFIDTLRDIKTFDNTLIELVKNDVDGILESSLVTILSTPDNTIPPSIKIELFKIYKTDPRKAEELASELLRNMSEIEELKKRRVESRGF